MVTSSILQSSQIEAQKTKVLKIKVQDKPNHLSAKNRLTGTLFVLALMTLLVGCTGISTKKTIEKQNANADQQAQSNKPNATTPNIGTLILDTKLNIQFDWWKILQSSQLNSLIDQLLDANPSEEGAQGVLLKLRQNDISREGYLYSSINVSDAAEGKSQLLLVQDIPVSDEAKFIGDANYEIHVWPVTVGYMPEMLRSGRTTASTKVEIDTQNFKIEGTYRTLAANLIACVIQDAAVRAQMSAVRKIVAIEQKYLTTTQNKINAGLESPIEEASKEQSVELALQAMNRLKEQLEQIREIEKILVKASEDKGLQESIDLAQLNLRINLPLELSTSIFEQRPDVRAAQLEINQTNGNYQTAADHAKKNMESTLFTIYNDAISQKAAIASEREKLEMLEASRKQYKANPVNYQDVLTAELNFQFATLRSVQARAKQLGNAVLLYHAAGGGWWNRDDEVKLEIDRELPRIIH
jgi:outer membrane protein TolC